LYDEYPQTYGPIPYELLPFNANGFFLGYKTQTSTPTSVTYSTGPYYHGHLNSWSYLTTLPVRRGVRLSLELDQNAYAPQASLQPAWAIAQFGAEPSATQWLERAGVDWQFNRYASLDLGVRRIVGRNIPNAYQLPNLPSTGTCVPTDLNSACYSPFDLVNAGNASMAFHFLAARNEFYVVYGNPNNLATYPALYVKWIRYIGAEKGT
jgi:hypothetical protein